MGLVSEIHIKAALCSPEVRDHYRACLAAADVIAKHGLEKELSDQFDRVCSVQEAISESLDTTFRENRKKFG